MTVIGTMQGRLVEPENNTIQAFPRERWRDEFPRAAEAGLNSIEWIHDSYGYDFNPLLRAEGRAEMLQLSKQYGIAVRSVCADWFMEKPLVQSSGQERENRRNHLRDLLPMAREVGANRVVIPFVDNSSLRTTQDQHDAVAMLGGLVADARAAGVELHLETDLGPSGFADLLSALPEDLFFVNYDTGNSASLGYSPAEEFSAYGRRVGSVHIKDRRRGSSTVPLGTGDCDFSAVRSGLRQAGYTRDYILQAARGTPGDEVAWARQNRHFVLDWLKG